MAESCRLTDDRLTVPSRQKNSAGTPIIPGTHGRAGRESFLVAESCPCYHARPAFREAETFRRHGGKIYTVESHLCFEASVRAGELLSYRSQLLGYDAKRLYIFTD